MWVGLVGSHDPGWLGRRVIRGTRFEVLMEECVVKGAATDTEGLVESLAPVVTEETGTRIEDSGRKNGTDVGDGDGDRGSADKEGGE